jgi:hypothetical protein
MDLCQSAFGATSNNPLSSFDKGVSFSGDDDDMLHDFGLDVGTEICEDAKHTGDGM